MKRLEIQILGVAETRFVGQGTLTLEDGTMIVHSGVEQGAVREKGVAIMLSKEAGKALLGYNPVSERIVSVRLASAPHDLTFIQVYAPTEQAEDTDKEYFYDVLQNTLDSVPESDTIIIGGDFNAQIGKDSPIGPFALNGCNDNGDRLTHFCLANRYLAENAMISHHPRRMYTWKSPSLDLRSTLAKRL